MSERALGLMDAAPGKGLPLFALSREQGGAGLSAEAARRIPILARSADQVAPAVVTAVGADGLFRPPLDDAPDLPAAASPAPSVEAHHA